MSYTVTFSRPGETQAYHTLRARVGGFYAKGEVALTGGTLEILRGEFCGQGTLKLNAPVPGAEPGDWVRVWLDEDGDHPLYLGQIEEEMWGEGPGDLKLASLTDTVAKTAWSGEFQLPFRDYVQEAIRRCVLPPGVRAGEIPYDPTVLKVRTDFELLGDTCNAALPALDGGTWGVAADATIGVHRPSQTVTHRFPRGSADTPRGSFQGYANCVRFNYAAPDGTQKTFAARVAEEIARRGEVWDASPQVPARVQEAVSDNPLEGQQADVTMSVSYVPAQENNGTVSQGPFFLTRRVPAFSSDWTGKLLEGYAGGAALTGTDLPLRSWDEARVTFNNLGKNHAWWGANYVRQEDGSVRWYYPKYRVSLRGLQPGIPVKVTLRLEREIAYWDYHRRVAVPLPREWSVTVTPTSTTREVDVTAAIRGFDPLESETLGPWIRNDNPPVPNVPRSLSLTVEYLPPAGAALPASGFEVSPLWELGPDGHHRHLWNDSVVDVAVRDTADLIRTRLNLSLNTYYTPNPDLNGTLSSRIAPVGNFTLPTSATVKLPASLLLVNGSAVLAQGAGGLRFQTADGEQRAVAGEPVGNDTRWLWQGADLSVSGMVVEGDPGQVGRLLFQIPSTAPLAAYAYGLLRYRTQPVRVWTGHYSSLKRVAAYGVALFDTPRGDVALDVQRVVYDLEKQTVAVECGTPMARDDADAVAAAIERVERGVRMQGGG